MYTAMLYTILIFFNSPIIHPYIFVLLQANEIRKGYFISSMEFIYMHIYG